MTGKTLECYWHAFNGLYQLLIQLLLTLLMLTLKEPSALKFLTTSLKLRSLVAFFHFKQSVGRKMIKLGIPNDEVKFCMRHGIIDLLTVIPKDDLNPKGVNFIAAMIFDYCAKLYDKGTDKYKESEECWVFSGEIISFHELSNLKNRFLSFALISCCSFLVGA